MITDDTQNPFTYLFVVVLKHRQVQLLDQFLETSISSRSDTQTSSSWAARTNAMRES